MLRVFILFLNLVRYICRQRYESVSSNGEDTLNSPINPEDLELPACTTPSLPPKEFFFYQCKF